MLNFFYIRKEACHIKDHKIGVQWWHGPNLFLRDGEKICLVGRRAKAENGKMIAIILQQLGEGR